MQANDITGDATAEGRGRVVLQVLPRLETGGVERGTVDVAAAAAARGDTSLVASAGGPLTYQVERAGAEHVTLPLHRKDPWSLWRNAALLEALIRERGVEIVHVRSRAPAWSAWLAARRTGARFLTTFHGTYNFRSGLKRRYNAVMTKGDLVIAISHFIARHMQENYEIDPARVRVVPRGTDLALFDPSRIHPDRLAKLAQRWRLPDGVPMIMLPGRLTRWKGQTLLVEALMRLRERDFVCVLVGSDQGRSGYREELEKLIGDLGLGRKVILGGDCNDIAAAYMLCDVVVSASTDPEAFGRVASEAQAMGRPLVAADHGGVPEQVLDGETACLVRPGDAADLARGLTWALDLDTQARERLARTARAQARKFTREGMCASTLAVYDELAALGAQVRTPEQMSRIDTAGAQRSLTEL